MLLRVFADESIEDRRSSDACGSEVGDRRSGLDRRRELSSGLMRPMLVVVNDVLAQHREQVPLTMDQDTVQTLTAERIHRSARRSLAAPAPGCG
jgi:hypothetical protein